jgi:molybdate transport system substrate-binding protein
VKKSIRFLSCGRTFLLGALLLGTLLSAAASADVVAAAASLQACIQNATAQFDKEKGIRLEAVFGASGNLAKQIEMGAPFDLFLSADEKWTRYLEEKGKLEKVRPVAECPLVLWWAKPKAPEMNLVDDPKMRVAIADPAVAPFGAMAKKYLEDTKRYGKIEKAGRLIIGGDVTKTGLAAKSGGADLAFLPLSTALLLKEGSFAKVPIAPQRLFGGLVKGRDSLAARAFFDYLGSAKAEPIFREAGFDPLGR